MIITVQTQTLNASHTFIDPNAGYDAWGALCADDFDGDGLPEVTMGGKDDGFFFVYDYNTQTGLWERHTITMDILPNAGAAATDLNNDGIPEIVCGEWGPRLLYFMNTQRSLDTWQMHEVFSGIVDPHDLLAADLTGQGRDNIIVREKNGRLFVFSIPENPLEHWKPHILSEHNPGDGTAAADITSNGPLDILTNNCWFENVNGNGTAWVRRPLLPKGFDFHPESRIAFGNVGGCDDPVAVITESEIPDARMAILHFVSKGRAWEPELIFHHHHHVGGLHTLQICDLDNDGENEIFTAEMENERTNGINRKPRWWMIKNINGSWERISILDKNLGAHSALAADFDGDGRLEIVGKIWRANNINGANGNNHVDFVRFKGE